MQRYTYHPVKNQKQPPVVFCKIDFFKYIAKFTGKHLCQSLMVFSCEFCEIFKNTFFTEHFRTTASEKSLTELFMWQYLTCWKLHHRSLTGFLIHLWDPQKQPPEVFCEKSLLLNISQYSQESTCVGASLRSQHRCFPVNITKFLRIPFWQTTANGCFWI